MTNDNKELVSSLLSLIKEKEGLNNQKKAAEIIARATCSSLPTVHSWLYGTRQPSAAAKVLLNILLDQYKNK